MRSVLTALAALSGRSAVTEERETFMDLVEKEIKRLNSKLEARGVGKMVFSRGQLAVDRAQVDEAAGQAALESRVGGMLKRVERELDEVEGKIGGKLRVLDLDDDGIISPEELRGAMSFLREQLGEDELRAMLETLSAEAGKDGGIDVCKLMDLAYHDEDSDKED